MPGDKSISHRALILAACAIGKTKINGLLESEDVNATRICLQKLGVQITKENGKSQNNHKDKAITQKENGCYYVFGAGIDALQEPKDILDCGNSGTSARLLAGLIASRKFNAVINGDKSLRQRPMDRLFKYLKPLGIQPRLQRKKFLPLSLGGIQTPLPIKCKLQSPSAQIKSALLLFALAAQGVSKISEPFPSRDHSERMLLLFKANLKIEKDEQNNEKNITKINTPNTNTNRKLIIKGGKALIAPEVINIPGDISSAAFFILAATICKNSEILLRNVGVNPTRMGFVQTLIEMGADIHISHIKNTKSNQSQHEEALEPTADITIKSAQLNGVTVPAERAASMIDEYPALAMAAASANGKTVMMGLEELRIKESDRIEAIKKGLEKCSLHCEQEKDTLTIVGAELGQKNIKLKEKNISINAYGDHRIAMSFITLGLALSANDEKNIIIVDSAEAIATSFPDFIQRMQKIGANVREIQ